MNVVLIGYRGTGKSCVARQLADELGMRVVSLDSEIERKAGLSIPQIVQQVGWPGFRDLEQEIAATFAAEDGLVIDCGGGIIEREANHTVLRSAGTVVWLTASTETIVHRIQGDDQRPSLTGTKSFTEEVVEVLQRRTPLYQRMAHFPVDTDGRTIAQVVAQVRQLLDAESSSDSRAN